MFESFRLTRAGETWCLRDLFFPDAMPRSFLYYDRASTIEILKKGRGAWGLKLKWNLTLPFGVKWGNKLFYSRPISSRTLSQITISVRDRFQRGGWGLFPESFLHRLNSQNERTTKPFLQQNCAYIFYAILDWHRNGYKQNNINWQYVKSKSAELFFSDPRLWEKKDFCPKNGNVTRRNWRCPNRGEGCSPPCSYAYANNWSLVECFMLVFINWIAEKLLFWELVGYYCVSYTSFRKKQKQ